MAKIGYIMATAHYDKLEEDRQWMQEYGCVKIVEENDADEKNRPLWKQLMIALERGDELVISKYSNAIRGARELAMFLEFCRVKVIRVISIHDRIDSQNELFPETKPSDVLLMIGSLPDEALVLRKSSEHVSKLQERMIVQLPPVSTSKEKRMDREKTVELGNQVYGITPFDMNSQLHMLEEFLLEKGKERSKIDLFIKTLSQLPIQLTLSYYVTAIDYYITKYNVFRLSNNNKVILIY